MTNQIFIGYATGDEDSAREFYNVLGRIQNTEVYIPEWVDTKEKNQYQKIKEGLDRANLAVFLITFNSTNTMWLNQEIGYACARNIPIISVVEKGIDVKGFLEGRQHITFQRGDFKISTYQVVSKMRKILAQTKTPITHFQITCPTCEKNYLELLPSQEETDNKIETGQKFNYSCKHCSSTLYIEPMTFASQNCS